MEQIESALRSVHDYLGQSCPHYQRALQHALATTRPIFVEPVYVKHFWDLAVRQRGWLQTVIVDSAIAESEGSRRLLRYWQLMRNDEPGAREVLWHARDESRHAGLFINLVELAFPGFLPPEQKEEITSGFHSIPTNPDKAEGKLTEDILYSYVASINMAEIRTLINLHLVAPLFYELSPRNSKDEVREILCSLQRDEIRHIAYTAKLYEQHAEDVGEDVAAEKYEAHLIEFGNQSLSGLDVVRGMFPGTSSSAAD
jgi:hypothetical protein